MSNMYVILKTAIIAELKRALIKTIVEFCAKDIRPMEIISGEGFVRLAQHLVSIGATYGNVDVSRILPHPTTISRNVKKVKEEMHQKIFPIIEKAMENGECAATTDMWTQDYKKNPFITVTTHFFDENFTLHRQVLFTSLFKRIKKSGNNIRMEMVRRFKELGYKAKLLFKIRFVTDQGSNMIKALKSPYTRDNCRTHLLNTVLRNTFESDDLPLIFSKVLVQCKNMVRYLKQSGKSSKLPHAVKQECDTRWNSILEMLNSIVDQYSEVRSSLTQTQNVKWGIDINFVKDIIRFLVPFKDATKALEGDKHPTANKILLSWADIKTHLNPSKFANPAMKQIVEIAIKFFKSKFEITMNNKIACFLDPRYRFLKMLSEDERNEVFNEVKRIMKTLLIPQNTKRHNDPPPVKKSRFSTFEDDTNCSEFESEIEMEFQSYMKTSRYYQYVDTDDYKKDLVELFWRDNKNSFPILAKLARMILVVPASSSTSERVFSDAGHTCNTRRTNLKPEVLDDLLFIRSSLTL